MQTILGLVNSLSKDANDFDPEKDNRHLPVQIGDLSKIGLRQAPEFFFLYNLQKNRFVISSTVWPQFEKQDLFH